MEIIKLNWPRPWPVVHACADPSYVRYLEDRLVLRDPKPLTRGALDLLVSSIETAVTELNAVYVVHLEADTWVFDQDVIARYLEQLTQIPGAIIAASSWSTDYSSQWKRSNNIGRRLRALLASVIRPLGFSYGIRNRRSLSTQFFIAKATPAFLKMLKSLRVTDHAVLEKSLYEHVIDHFGKDAIIGMPEREPVHPRFRDSCEALSLVCHHFPSAADKSTNSSDGNQAAHDRKGKKEWLRNARLKTYGPHMQRLLTSPNLDYYNGTAKR